MRLRMDKEERRKSILTAALALSEAVGYNAFSRSMIASSASCSKPLVSSVFGTMQNLRNEIVKHAIEVENLTIIGQAIALRHPIALKLPDELKEKAKASLFPRS